MLVKLKDSLLPAIKDIQGEMKDILRQDVADCNAKMLGEVKYAIKDIQGELKDSLRQDFADNNTKMLGKLKDSLLPVGVMKDILRQDIADCNTNMLGELKDSLLPARGVAASRFVGRQELVAYKGLVLTLGSMITIPVVWSM